MAVNSGMGLGTSGIGDNFARARLALAKRSGYLPPDTPTPMDPGAASAQWHMASKNLAANARGAGYPNPMMFLRTGLYNGGQLPKPIGHGARAPMQPGAAYLPSQAARPTVGNPFSILQRYLPPTMGY